MSFSDLQHKFGKTVADDRHDAHEAKKKECESTVISTKWSPTGPVPSVYAKYVRGLSGKYKCIDPTGKNKVALPTGGSKKRRRKTHKRKRKTYKPRKVHRRKSRKSCKVHRRKSRKSCKVHRRK